MKNYDELTDLKNMTVTFTDNSTVTAKYTEEHIKKDTIPEGKYIYETSEKEGSNYFFDTIEESVSENFKGSLITDEKINLGDKKKLEVNSDYNYVFNA